MVCTRVDEEQEMKSNSPNTFSRCNFAYYDSKKWHFRCWSKETAFIEEIRQVDFHHECRFYERPLSGFKRCKHNALNNSHGFSDRFVCTCKAAIKEAHLVAAMEEL